MATTDHLPPIPPTDDDWLALLAGRPAPDASLRTRQEADLLRQPVLAQQARSDKTLSDAALIQGRERLRREISPPAPGTGWGLPPSRFSGPNTG